MESFLSIQLYAVSSLKLEKAHSPTIILINMSEYMRISCGLFIFLLGIPFLSDIQTGDVWKNNSFYVNSKVLYSILLWYTES